MNTLGLALTWLEMRRVQAEDRFRLAIDTIMAVERVASDMDGEAEDVLDSVRTLLSAAAPFLSGLPEYRPGGGKRVAVKFRRTNTGFGLALGPSESDHDPRDRAQIENAMEALCDWLSVNGQPKLERGAATREHQDAAKLEIERRLRACLPGYTIEIVEE